MIISRIKSTFQVKQKTFFLVSQEPCFKLTKETSKNVAEATFKLKAKFWSLIKCNNMGYKARVSITWWPKVLIYWALNQVKLSVPSLLDKGFKLPIFFILLKVSSNDGDIYIPTIGHYIVLLWDTVTWKLNIHLY